MFRVGRSGSAPSSAAIAGSARWTPSSAITLTGRTQEFGIRMARGAAACWGSVIREGLVLVTIGLGLGMAGALVLTKLMGAVVFDPPIAPLPPAGAWLASRLPRPTSMREV